MKIKNLSWGITQTYQFYLNFKVTVSLLSELGFYGIKVFYLMIFKPISEPFQAVLIEKKYIYSILLELNCAYH